MQKLLVIICSLLSFSALGAENQSSLLSEKDTFILVDNLLRLTDQPKDIKDQLTKYKKWENLYINIRRNAHKSVKNMGVYFFVVFIAESKAMVHTQEDISHEILALYNKDKSLFLKALNQNPAFIPMVCSKLGEHFSFVGKNKLLNEFIQNNKSLINEKLYKPYGNKCLQEIEKHGT